MLFSPEQDSNTTQTGYKRLTLMCYRRYVASTMLGFGIALTLEKETALRAVICGLILL